MNLRLLLWPILTFLSFACGFGVPFAQGQPAAPLSSFAQRIPSQEAITSGVDDLRSRTATHLATSSPVRFVPSFSANARRRMQPILAVEPRIATPLAANHDTLPSQH